MSLGKVFALFLCLLAFEAFAQDLTTLNKERLQRNKIGMVVLGSWAIANIGSSPILRASADGSRKYFYDMNLYWNLVNLGLAGFGYWSAVTTDPSVFDLGSTLSEQASMEKILLFNAGLDVGYMLGGLYLIERSRRGGRNSERLKGFGQSIILQGAFLFGFDLVFFIAQNRGGSQMMDLLSSMHVGPSGLSLSINF